MASTAQGPTKGLDESHLHFVHLLPDLREVGFTDVLHGQPTSLPTGSRGTRSSTSTSTDSPGTPRCRSDVLIRATAEPALLAYSAGRLKLTWAPISVIPRARANICEATGRARHWGR